MPDAACTPYPAYGQVPVGMIKRVSVASGNEYPMRPASYIRTAPTVYPNSSPAGTWFAGNAQASSYGFRVRCPTVCSRQTPHVPGKRDNSWSTRAQPECRAPSYRPDYRCGSRHPRPCHIACRRQLQRFFHRFEGGHRQHRTKNFFWNTRILF